MGRKTVFNGEVKQCEILLQCSFIWFNCIAIEKNSLTWYLIIINNSLGLCRWLFTQPSLRESNELRINFVLVSSSIWMLYAFWFLLFKVVEFFSPTWTLETNSELRTKQLLSGLKVLPPDWLASEKQPIRDRGTISNVRLRTRKVHKRTLS